jgi:hypothetical protein
MALSEHPILLQPIDSVKSWGSERWLNSTRPEGAAGIRGVEPARTLAEAIASDPSLLGEWSRRLFGDELPIFTKIIRADFPPFVHVGFQRAVTRGELLGWLETEQTLLRQLFADLRVESKEAFAGLSSLYASWATEQAQASWLRNDTVELAVRLQPFLRAAGVGKPTTYETIAETLDALRHNRARIAEAVNEVDLRSEAGNLLLTSAGILHAIFGLSHQTHPLDTSRAALQSLYGELAKKVAAGASDDQLRAIVDAVGLSALRENGDAPPKNEAWMPVMLDGRLALVEPQQSSDTTYSVADFYTPFVWDGERLRFRKGDATHGLSSETLRRQLADLQLSPTSLDDIRRVPTLVTGASPSTPARLSRIVDEPQRWPFFTAYQVDLDGAPTSEVRFRGDHAPGVFQQLVVLDGTLELVDAGGQRATLDRETPAFIPGTLQGGYELITRSQTRVLLFSVPGPRPLLHESHK